MQENDFVEYDAETVIEDALKTLDEGLGLLLENSDERRIFLLVALNAITAAYHKINDAAKQNLLRYAKWPVLDAIGQDRGVFRLPATPAKTTVQFTLSAPQSRNTLIPQGIRVTPDGKLFFHTSEFLSISAGELTGAVEAYCSEPGTKANGIRVGAIKTLVDPIPYVAGVTNITQTSGGADEELDDPYRERIRQAPERFTTTGTEESYVFWAKTASPAILDVKPGTPSPGRIHLTVLAPPEDEAGILEEVRSICAGNKRRTFTDYVTVSGPEAVHFNVDVIYTTTTDDEAKAVAAIEGEGGAIDQYIKWQTGKLGREINPDYLNMLLIQNGAFKVDIRSPVRQAVTNQQVARLASRSVSHEVIKWT